MTTGHRALRPFRPSTSPVLAVRKTAPMFLCGGYQMLAGDPRADRPGRRGLPQRWRRPASPSTAPMWWDGMERFTGRLVREPAARRVDASAAAISSAEAASPGGTAADVGCGSGARIDQAYAKAYPELSLRRLRRLRGSARASPGERRGRRGGAIRSAFELLDVGRRVCPSKLRPGHRRSTSSTTRSTRAAWCKAIREGAEDDGSYLMPGDQLRRPPRGQLGAAGSDVLRLQRLLLHDHLARPRR